MIGAVLFFLLSALAVLFGAVGFIALLVLLGAARLETRALRLWRRQGSRQ